MLDGGHGHAGRVDAELCGEQLFDTREDGDGELRGGFPRATGVGFDGGHQSDAEAGDFELAQNAEMVAAKGAGAGHGHADAIAGRIADGVLRRCSGDGAAALPVHAPCTALRQRP